MSLPCGRSLARLVIGVSLASPLCGQVGNEWQVFTSMREINQVFVDRRGDIWAATDGGVLQYQRDTRQYHRFTRLDGLAGSRQLSVTQDESGDLWFGSDGHGLSRYRPATGGFDLFFQFDGLRINTTLVRGDRLYVGTQEGVTVLSIGAEEVRETYRQFGTLTRNIEVTGLAVLDSVLYVTTVEGAAWAPLSESNLQDPDSWSVLTLPNGLVDAVADGSHAYMAGSVGVFANLTDGSNWVIHELTGRPVLSLGLMAGRVIAATQGGDFFRRSGNGDWARTAAPNITGVRDMSERDSALWLATGNGLQVLGEDAPPPSREPAANRFYEMEIADDGLWIASVPNDLQASFGVYQLGERGWTVHDRSSGMRSNALVSVEADARQRVWVGSWGNGLSVRSGRSWRHLDHRNSPLIGIGFSNDFVAVSDIARDEHGNMWVVNVLGGVVVVDGYPITRSFAFEQEWLGFERDMHKVFPAPDGIKWVTSRLEGLALLDDGGTPFEGGDDRTTRIDQAIEARMSSNRVFDLLPAADGTIWVATDNGVNSFRGTYSRESGEFSVESWRVYTTADGLGSNEINDLETDSEQNIWVATGAGVTRIAHGEVEFTLTKNNSKLIDDQVNSLLFDEATRQMWIGTAAGLSRLQLGVGEAAQEEESAAGVRIYPNPFEARRGSVTVSGISPGSAVEIYQMNGRLVRRLHGVPGTDSHSWDGRNQAGSAVESGVYLLVATGPEGTFRAKLAVINDM